jgi:hypothetical protein
MQAAVRERSSKFMRLVALLLGCVGVPPANSAQASASHTGPVRLTAEQDHQRLMELLHITSLRPGPSGDPKAPDAANVDQSKVPPYALPDPLLFENGKPVNNEETWWKLRRPEIVEEFDREVFGRGPKTTLRVNWEVAGSRKEEKYGVPVITKNLLGHVDNAAYPQIKVDIELTLTTPVKTRGPVPVMMELGWSAKTLEALRSHFTAEQWAEFIGKGPSWQQQVLALGWGYATLIPTSLQADKGDGLTEGIIGLVNHGQPRTLDDWERCGRGRGAPVGLWTISKQIKRWTQRRWELRGFRVTERLRWWRWPTIRVLRLDSSLLRERAARRFCDASLANRWRIWRRRANIIGWREIF